MSTYMYRKSLLSQLAAPTSSAAVPDASSPTARFGVEQGAAKTQTQTLQSAEKLARSTMEEKNRRFTANLELKRAKLAESNRQFMTNLSKDRQMIDAWADSNQWATAIGVGNLGVTGLGFYAQSLQDAETRKMQEEYNTTITSILKKLSER